MRHVQFTVFLRSQGMITESATALPAALGQRTKPLSGSAFGGAGLVARAGIGKP